MMWEFHAILMPMVFVIGTLVGSFANVCIYRIPWQKSIFWPPSTCPKCLTPIAPRDNVPIIGWLLLGRKCRSCHAPIAARYPLIELLVGVLFAVVYVTDVVMGERVLYSGALGPAFSRLGYHLALTTFLVVATFIDYDLEIIPDEVTVPGMLVGLIGGTLLPGIRLEPATAETWQGGLAVGVVGLIAGGAVIYAVRLLAFVLFRKEGMGLGDVTLVAMIGAFLGWQVVPLVLFLGALLGLGHSVLRVGLILKNKLAGRPAPSTAIPFGPYLSLAAFLLMCSWRWLWPGWAGPLYKAYGEVIALLAKVYLEVGG